jgi:hypothetical protein
LVSKISKISETLLPLPSSLKKNVATNGDVFAYTAAITDITDFYCCSTGKKYQKKVVVYASLTSLFSLTGLPIFFPLFLFVAASKMVVDRVVGKDGAWQLDHPHIGVASTHAS